MGERYSEPGKVIYAFFGKTNIMSKRFAKDG
jgi:hypothetical protein